jgi:hypothetical protein
MPSAKVIYSNTLSATTNSVSINSIPSTYKHLWLQVSGRSADFGDWFECGINGSTNGPDYFSRLIYWDLGGTTGSTGSQVPAAGTMPLTGPINYANSLANSYSSAGVMFFNYAATGNVKVFSGTGGQNNSATPSRQVFWDNRNNAITTPITSILLRVQTSTVNSLGAGTTFTLYGLP